MHNKSFVLGFMLCLLALPVIAQTEEEREQAQQAPELESKNAEYTRRSLPAESFKPSEEISEDFPVPFPVDI